MSDNSLILSDKVSPKTKIKVYELCDSKGNSYFDNFCNEIETDDKLLEQLAKAIRIIEATANLKRQTKNKFRQLETPKEISHKFYEAKAGSIRIYLIHLEKTGRVIISGGLKSNQKKDLKSMIKKIKNHL